ncbi:uncharacterized protein SCODWIG_03001 [Saccharomycodes ludwigii]|uniref:RING-type E3 ubiquitin transferase n=2 Tax=Saccharomycodes ludwigii TaxID=36035 RepID=A0A376BAS3_9ASCO|nr:uncharacterized protein SCODWIG_03001 [Saccharomycodes ludwigii]
MYQREQDQEVLSFYETRSDLPPYRTCITCYNILQRDHMSLSAEQYHRKKLRQNRRDRGVTNTFFTTATISNVSSNEPNVKNDNGIVLIEERLEDEEDGEGDTESRTEIRSSSASTMTTATTTTTALSTGNNNNMNGSTNSSTVSNLDNSGSANLPSASIHRILDNNTKKLAANKKKSCKRKSIKKTKKKLKQSLNHDQDADDDERARCPICNEKLTSLTEEESQVHINECLHKAESIHQHHYNDKTSPSSTNRMLVYAVKDNKENHYEECPICFELMEPGQKIGRLECFCVFHYKCIKEWFNKKRQKSKDYSKNWCPFHDAIL